MRVIAALLLGVLFIAPVRATDDLTPPIQKLLASIRAADKGQLAVSEEDGRFLRVLIASTGAKQVLEIGAASGYSAIWMGLGLRQTGGHLTTIEYDAVRAKEADANIRRAGLADVVTVISGDAFKEVPKLQGTFDLVFLDAPFPCQGKSDVDGIFDPPYYEWFQFNEVQSLLFSFVYIHDEASSWCKN